MDQRKTPMRLLKMFSMFSEGEIRKSHVLVVVVVVLINVVAFLGAARFMVVFYKLPVEAEVVATRNAGGGSFADNSSLSAYFPVCVLLSVGDDTSEVNDAALPFPLLYRLFDTAKTQIMQTARRNGDRTDASGGSNRATSNSRVNVLVGVDYPSVACNMANDSLHNDFMDEFPDVEVKLMCGTPEVVKRNLADNHEANSTELEHVTVQCGTAIAGRSTRHVAQINAAWAQFVRWDNFHAIDLDEPDPSRNSPALPREQWRPTIVTAFSSNHFAVTLLLLRSLGKAGQEVAQAGQHNISIVVYALEDFDTVLEGVLGCLVKELNDKFNVPTEIRQFNFSAYPSWMRINQTKGYFGGTGEYAWKAVLIHEVLVERGFVVWADGGTRFESYGLGQTLNYTQEKGFSCAHSWGDVPLFVHGGQIKYFRYQVKTDRNVSNCDAGRIGFTLDSYDSVARPWYDCSMTRQCIAPEGSNRNNHRQDQAALTLIADMSGNPCQGIPYMVLIHMDYKPDDFSWTLPTPCYQDPLVVASTP